jgi:large subunit ribosomal protein L2
MINYNLLFYKKPTSPGLRHQVFLRKYLLSFFYLKKLMLNINYKGGRNNNGHITVRHKKKKITKHKILINSNYNLFFNVIFKLNLILYDSIRNNFIMLLKSNNGIYFYRPYIEGLLLNNLIFNYENVPTIFTPGSSCKMNYLPEGTLISNVELYPNKGSQLIRSSGTGTYLLSKENNKILITLCTKKCIKISMHCVGLIGRNSNIFNFQLNLGKAGRSNYYGIRPTVRGVAMNPIDHPHGGGEGKKSKKVIPHSPWGKVCRYKKTSRNIKKLNK